MPPPLPASSAEAARPPGTSYIPTLDGWRAVAITAVLFCHGLDQKQFPVAMPLGLAGVLLFFALSGFLITSRLVDEHALMGQVSFSKFYQRRAFRILPPALFYLSVTAVLGFLRVIPFSGIDSAKALFFVRNDTPLDLGNPGSWYSVHFWSLSVEEHFYLVWPALLVLVWTVVSRSSRLQARWRQAGRWAAFSIAVALAIATILWRGADEHYQLVIRFFHSPWLAQNVGRTDYMADVLLWGCALALLLGSKTPSHAATPNAWRRRIPRGYTTLFAAVVIAFIGFVSFGKSISHGRELMHLCMALLIGATVTDPGSVLGRLLELAPLRWIGRLSYSLYLWQELFFRADGAPLWFQRFPVNLAFIVASAWLSYRFVERPLVRLGHRFAQTGPAGHRDDLPHAEPASVRA